MSTRILRRIACLAIAAAIGVLWTPSSANANMRLELNNTTTGTGTILTDAANTGTLTFPGAIGAFTVNVTTGTSAPPLGVLPGFVASLDLNTVNVSSTTAASMTIILENTYSGLPTGAAVATGSIGGTLTNGTVTATAWVDPTSAVPALGPDQVVGPIGPPPAVPVGATSLQDLSLSTSASPFAASGQHSFTSLGTFSLYQEIVITFGFGGGSFSGNLQDQVSVPEPSTLAIAGLGALGMIGYGLRRRALGA